MEVFVMIRHKKTTIFASAKDQSTVAELKKIVGGILKTSPDDQQLWKDGVLLEDEKLLTDYNLTAETAKAQDPASIGLALKGENGEWEKLQIAALSVPPELPEVMRPQEPMNEQIAAN